LNSGSCELNNNNQLYLCHNNFDYNLHNHLLNCPNRHDHGDSDGCMNYLSNSSLNISILISTNKMDKNKYHFKKIKFETCKSMFFFIQNFSFCTFLYYRYKKLDYFLKIGYMYKIFKQKVHFLHKILPQ
jgi:hypothetical protein